MRSGFKRPPAQPRLDLKGGTRKRCWYVGMSGGVVYATINDGTLFFLPASPLAARTTSLSLLRCFFFPEHPFRALAEHWQADPTAKCCKCGVCWRACVPSDGLIMIGFALNRAAASAPHHGRPQLFPRSSSRKL